ncbi:MAG TPA: hypothetical protein VE956_05240 [Nodularia sp. (in: cyanobacteria)]|nr:hypothetical protein [Nodularia sp. (in: cyanobacteria)]
MSVQTIQTNLMDLSVEEQEILSGGKAKANKGTIEVEDAVFKFGGEEYPATISITVSDLPSNHTPEPTPEPVDD